MPEPHYISQPSIVGLARGLMGGIDLDPCTSPHANALHQIPNAYGPGGVLAWARADDILPRVLSPHDGGLCASLPWFGRMYVNPPGGRDVRRWWDRLLAEWIQGTVEQAVFMGFNIEHLRTGQHALEFPLCIPAKRLEFINPHTLTIDKQARHANAVIWLPPAPQDDRSCWIPELSYHWVSFFRSHMKGLGPCR